MKLLLDTHVWLWALLEPDRLKSRVRRTIADRGSELWLSSISIWEAALLVERGRLTPSGPAASWLDQALQSLPVRDAPLTRDVARASRSLALPHDDPADRFIAATAHVHGLTLVTADRALLQSTAYAVLPAGRRQP